MKKITFAVIAFLAFITNAFAQQTYYDTTFGNNGRLTTTTANQSSTLKIIEHNNALYAFMYILEDGYSISKYGLDGTLDSNFFISIPSDVYYWNSGDAFQSFMEFTADEKLLVATHSLGIDGNDTNLYNVCRYNTDGTIDTGYGTNGYATMALETGDYSIVLLNADRTENNDLITVGYSSQAIIVNKFDVNGNRYTNIWDGGAIRYSITQGTNYPIQSCFSVQDNCVYIAFNNMESNFSMTATIVKLDLATGLNDSNFGTNGMLTLNDGEMFARFALDNNNKLLVATTSTDDNLMAHTLYKYNSNGTPVADFGTNGAVPIIDNGVEIRKIVVADNGKLTIMTENYDEDGIAFYKLNADATADTTFGIGGKIARQEQNGATNTHWAFDYIESEDYIIAAGSYRQGISDNLEATLFKFLPDGATSGTQHFNADGMALYPNPAKETAFIQGSLLLQKAEVFNTAGQLIATSALINNRFDVSTLPQGCYVVKLYSTDGKQYTKKLVKE